MQPRRYSVYRPAPVRRSYYRPRYTTYKARRKSKKQRIKYARKACGKLRKMVGYKDQSVTLDNGTVVYMRVPKYGFTQITTQAGVNTDGTPKLSIRYVRNSKAPMSVLRSINAGRTVEYKSNPNQQAALIEAYVSNANSGEDVSADVKRARIGGDL